VLENPPAVTEVPPARRTIEIPEETARGLEARIRESAFPDLNAFVAYVLARLLEDPPDGVPFSADEESRLKERLRSLGYID
jgi:hypothetical protein